MKVTHTFQHTISYSLKDKDTGKVEQFKVVFCFKTNKERKLFEKLKGVTTLTKN